ncbi:hypothetical protein JHK86_049341 [Glycine max]|nr:hypothetical protein JHK86_049341 [Glycine max]
MAIPMLRAAMISHSQSQPLIHSISAIYETAKRRKRVVFSSSSSSSSSELNPVIRSEVSFCVGTCLIPHPKKVNTGGEDAFFVSNYNGGVIAVADGVSGWAEEDVDPSLFPRELLANASNFVGDEEVNYDPQILIRKAHAATFSTGSATVSIVAMLEKNGTLKIANVGDCGLRLIRNGKQVCNVELIQGDTIVMGSDGLFDNVFDHEIVPTIVRYKDVAEAAKALANLASSHAMDSNFDSPYSLEARSRGFEPPLWKKILGMKLTGGKLDDITVIVGQIVSS